MQGLCGRALAAAMSIEIGALVWRACEGDCSSIIGATLVHDEPPIGEH